MHNTIGVAVSGLVLLGNGVAAAVALLQPNIIATCNQDNLLRCYSHTPAAATQYCASLTASTVTATVTPIVTVPASISTTGTVTVTTTILHALPGKREATTPELALEVARDIIVERAAALATITGDGKGWPVPPIPTALGCMTIGGTSYPASRVTSACSCANVPAVTTTTTVTAVATTTSTGTASVAATATAVCDPCGPVVQNPSFENGFADWQLLYNDPSSFLIKPQPAGTNGKYAAGVTIGTNGALGLRQTLRTTPGVTYHLSVDYEFSAYQPDCYLNAFRNGDWFWSFSPRYNPASVNQPATEKSMHWTADRCDDVLDIQFVCTAWENLNMYLDNIVVTQDSPIDSRCSA